MNTPPLQCSTKECENEFYLAYPGVPSKRFCLPCLGWKKKNS